MSALNKASLFAPSGPNVTIPFDTLLYISGELADIGGILDRVQIRMVATLLATISIGE